MKVLIIGMGKSGRGAARFLLKEGHEVVGMDQNSFTMDGVRPFMSQEKFNLVVLSPGIAPHHIKIPTGCEVIGEAELACRYIQNRCIGITGTNGKTTLTLLITHVLNSMGIKARALGNVGESLSEYLLNPDLEEIVVAELSSFQLETMESSPFDYGAIVNITPDHLDRYASFQAYAKVKCHLGTLVKKELVVCKEVARAFGAFLPRRKLKVVDVNSDVRIEKREGQLNVLGYDKVLCAMAICEKFGISWEAFTHSCKTFQRPQHRLEYIGEIGDVRFYNDSKGTNVAATLYAVHEIQGPIYLIVGGRGKNSSFLEWKQFPPKKVRGLFVIGEAAIQIKRELKEMIVVKCCKNLQEAVVNAYKKAKKGNAVLFSPGCASFDQFSSYEERGNKFKKYVFELSGLNL